MTPPSQARIKEVFAEAAELERAQRAAYLDSVCGSDAGLRFEVEKLLATHDSGEGILGSSSIGQFLLGDRVEPSTLAVGDRVGGRFRITRLIGTGGMGEVYEAEDEELGARVAIKTLREKFHSNPQFAARFRREIRLARIVTHPNVCRIYDFGTHQVNDRVVVYLSMELLEGETLADRLKRGPLPVSEAVEILRQIGAALNALHSVRVIHRDLKPSNVVLVNSETGSRAVLTDFGLAHGQEEKTRDDTLTVAGQVLGTPAYASPEQLTGKRVGAESDIYSLGMVMYEMFCGRRPFEAGTAVESAVQKLTGAPDPPSSVCAVSPAWDRLIMKCLEREPDQRPRDAQQFLAMLEAAERAPCGIEFEGAPADSGAGAESASLATTGWTSITPPAVVESLPSRVAWFPTRARWWLAAGFLLTLPVGLLNTPVGAPARRQLCRQFPGTAIFCDLPQDKDIAVFPFEIQASRDGPDRALAAGLARHVRESFHRLAPEPASMCVHLRTDQLSDSVQLVMTGSVIVEATSITVRMTVRENAATDGEPLILRKVERKWDRQAGGLYREPLEALGDALDIRFPEREWQAWVRTEPRRAASVSYYLEGLGRLEAGHAEQAVSAFTEAIDPARSFDFALGHVGLGDAYRLQFNKTRDKSWEVKARQAYRRAAPLDREFGFAGGEVSLGDLDAAAGNAEAAISHYRAALKLWPYDHPLQKKLATVYETAGKLDEAVAVYRENLRLAPNCWLPLNAIAGIYSRNRRLRDSEMALLELVRRFPDNGSAYNNLAFDYIKMGRFDDAVEMASRSLKVRVYPLAYSTLGRAYLYRGCPTDALVNLRKAVDLRREYFVTWANLADGLEVISPGSKELLEAASQAAELCRRALELSPTDGGARATYARNLQRLSRQAEALEHIRLVLQPESTDSRALLTAAEVLDLAGRREEALVVVERAFRSGVELPEVQVRSGLKQLRQDHKYVVMLRQLNLDPKADPGGLTSAQAAGCPNSDKPGLGLTKK